MYHFNRWLHCNKYLILLSYLSYVWLQSERSSRGGSRNSWWRGWYGVQGRSPWWDVRTEKLNTFAYLTVCFDCNFAHKLKHLILNRRKIGRPLHPQSKLLVNFFTEREHSRSRSLPVRLSSVCLSSVTFVHPVLRRLKFSAMFLCHVVPSPSVTFV